MSRTHHRSRSTSPSRTRRPTRRSTARRSRKFSLARTFGFPTFQDIEDTIDGAAALDIPGADPISNAIFAFRVARFFRRRNPKRRARPSRAVQYPSRHERRPTDLSGSFRLTWRLAILAFWLGVGILWVAYLWGATLLSVLIHGKRKTLARVLPALTGTPSPRQAHHILRQ